MISDTPWTEITVNPAVVGAQLAQMGAQKIKGKYKLERLSQRELMGILAFLYATSLAALVFGIALSTCKHFWFNPGSDVFLDYTLGLAVVVIDGVLRSVGCLLLLFLVLAFPQRIIRQAYYMKQMPAAESTLICVCVFFFSFTPAYSIWGLFMFWQQVQSNIDYSHSQGVLFAASVQTLTDGYTTAALVLQKVCACINLFLIYLFWGGLAYWQGHASFDAAANDDDDASALLMPVLRAGGKVGADNVPMVSQDDEADPNKTDELKEGVNWVVSLPQSVASELYTVITRALARVRGVLHGLPLTFALELVIYLGVALGLTFGFDFQPSQVPMVGILSVIRVCALDSAPYDSSLTVLQNVPHPNMTTRIRVTLEVHEISTPNSTASLCSPNRFGSIVFWRAISVAVMCIAEMLLLRHVIILARASRRRLSSLPLAKTRTYQLSFSFFQLNTFQVWLTIFVTAIIQLTVCPPVYWISESASFVTKNNELNVTITNDPLFAVGVTPSTQAWGPFFVMLGTWLLLMAYAYLPPDAHGALGWFTPTKPSARSRELLKDAGSVVYFATETQCQRACGLVDTVDKNSSTRSQLERALNSYGMNSLLIASGHRGLRAQLVAGAFVLETEILLFNFAYVAHEATDGRNVLVEDARFALAAHVRAPLAHCVVASSLDRVVVAFSVASEAKEGVHAADFSQADLPLAADVDPVFDNGDGGRFATRAAAQPAWVHGVYLHAFEQLKEELFTVLRRLLSENASRVVMLTGYSLGGGLAAVAAFHVAVELGMQGRVNATTFGAPKVGNYSFARRLARCVPALRRVALAGDLATKYPVAASVAHDWLYAGSFEVGTECVLDVTGNLIIRPSPTEKIMLQRGTSSMKHHKRLAYATALMAWAVRSHEEDASFDWWLVLVNTWWARAGPRLGFVNPAVRARLLADMMRTGATFSVNGKLMRDGAAGTGADTEEAFAASWVEMRLVTDLERARCEGDRDAFAAALAQLRDVRAQAGAPAPDEDVLGAMGSALRRGDWVDFDRLAAHLAQQRALAT